MVGARCISIYTMIVLQTAPFRNGTVSLPLFLTLCFSYDFFSLSLLWPIALALETVFFRNCHSRSTVICISMRI